MASPAYTLLIASLLLLDIDVSALPHAALPPTTHAARVDLRDRLLHLLLPLLSPPIFPTSVTIAATAAQKATHVAQLQSLLAGLRRRKIEDGFADLEGRLWKDVQGVRKSDLSEAQGPRSVCLSGPLSRFDADDETDAGSTRSSLLWLLRSCSIVFSSFLPPFLPALRHPT